MVLMSARTPAPPEGSTPAMESVLGIMLMGQDLLTAEGDGVGAETGRRSLARLQQPLGGRAGIGAVEFTWYPARQEGFAACLDRLLHGARHADRIACARNG